MTTYLKYYTDFIEENHEKMQKTTLFSGDHLMLGLNCLMPGQEHGLHSHPDQDKFYFVLEGSGLFVVGDQEQTASAGILVWAPAGITHGVSNQSSHNLVILMGMAPAP